jgi:hypothetical protein
VIEPSTVSARLRPAEDFPTTCLRLADRQTFPDEPEPVMPASVKSTAEVSPVLTEFTPLMLTVVGARPNLVAPI